MYQNILRDDAGGLDSYIDYKSTYAILQEVILDINDQMNLITRDRQDGETEPGQPAWRDRRR